MADQAVDLARLLRLDVDPADLHEQPRMVRSRAECAVHAVFARAQGRLLVELSRSGNLTS